MIWGSGKILGTFLEGTYNEEYIPFWGPYWGPLDGNYHI